MNDKTVSELLERMEKNGGKLPDDPLTGQEYVPLVPEWEEAVQEAKRQYDRKHNRKDTVPAVRVAKISIEELQARAENRYMRHNPRIYAIRPKAGFTPMRGTADMTPVSVRIKVRVMATLYVNEDIQVSSAEYRYQISTYYPDDGYGAWTTVYTSPDLDDITLYCMMHGLPVPTVYQEEIENVAVP